jgi:hypothetical protein
MSLQELQTGKADLQILNPGNEQACTLLSSTLLYSTQLTTEQKP